MRWRSFGPTGSVSETQMESAYASSVELNYRAEGRVIAPMSVLCEIIPVGFVSALCVGIKASVRSVGWTQWRLRGPKIMEGIQLINGRLITSSRLAKAADCADWRVIKPYVALVTAKKAAHFASGSTNNGASKRFSAKPGGSLSPNLILVGVVVGLVLGVWAR